MHDIFIVDQCNNHDYLLERFPYAQVIKPATSRKELYTQVSKLGVTELAWILDDRHDYTDFDLAYRPPWHQNEQLHVWPGVTQELGGDTVLLNRLEFLKQEHKIDSVQNYQNVAWKTVTVPNSTGPEIFVWSNSINEVEGAVTIRRIGSELDMMARTLRKAKTNNIWIISDTCDYTDFDFNWRPDWEQEEYLHVWPTENQVKGGDTMYVNVAHAQSQLYQLENLEHYNTIHWHSDAVKQKIKPQVVSWSRTNKDIGADITLRYIGSELDMMARTLRKIETPYFWVISDDCDYTDFDFDWRPSWVKQSYLHVWPTENQVKGGDTMYVNTAYMISQLIEIEDLEHYDVIDWHNDSIPQLVKPEVFVWDSTGNTDLFPDATVLRNVGDKFSMLEKTVRRASTPYIWVLNSNNDYSEFDFGWRPSWATQDHLHVWPSGTQTHGGDTMYINVAEFRKQVLEIQALDQYVPINWHNTVIEQTYKPDVVVWDNGKNQGNLEYIKTQYPDAIVLRNVGSRFDMMQRTIRHVTSSNAWIINSKCSYTDFDFTWRPGWATEKHLHVWPTENQTKGGDTFYIDVAEFQKQCLEIEKIEQYNAVTWHTHNISLCAEVDVIIWTFGSNQENLQRIRQEYPNAKSLRYIGTHLEMIKKSVKYTDSENFWVLSDCCEYTELDTNWRPDWETEKSIHCWASGSQEFGDTFYIPKAEFLNEADSLEKLEYYSSIIWHNNGYPRLPWPINYIESGDIYSAVTLHQFQSIYEYFVAPGSTLESTVDPSLWEKRHLIAYNKNGHVSLCPRDAIGSISDRLASYPYIQYHNCENSKQKPQDIVFISYDEKDADLNYDLLLKRFPKARRIHGVKGNVNAYKAAAKISSTPWYYAVFPKTKIDPNFGCNHHPNYLETPGHYIFNAHNVITDYAYGHGGVKMYHVKTTIEIENWGYDFTLSSPVTVIPVNSCYLVPASPYEAWRTSFREVLKLRNNTTVEGKYRLNRWLTGNYAEFGEYSIQGAKDALDFNGDVTIANSWEWLREQFNSRYD